jgi:uncharacterized protein (TIRG00374 family)
VSAQPARWLSWLIGAATFGAVVIVILQFSEATEFLRLLERIELWWLVAAACTQAFTYQCESEVWRTVTVAARTPVPRRLTIELAIAKLFVDQAIPTGGLSGTLVYVEGLRRAGVERRVAFSGVVVDTFSYYSAYALCVAVALVIAAAEDNLNGPLAAVAAVFAIASTAFALAVLMQIGLRKGPLRNALGRGKFLGRALKLLEEIDPGLAHNPRVLWRAVIWQVGIQLLDAVSLWFLLLSLGAVVELQTAFTSYMFSALFRTVSFAPGGLGTFEAAAVMILKSAGVPLATAFSATLLFRGLNFWLPMVPGMWFARRVLRRTSA